MKEEIALEARNRAGLLFKEGYNCAEAIFMAFKDEFSPEMDPNMVKLVTGFGGGLGHAGCMCGALMGAIMVLNIKYGRSSSQEDRMPAYVHAKQFHDRFVEKFNYTCCRALNPHPYDSPEHLKNCLKITGNTAKLLMEYLQEQE